MKCLNENQLIPIQSVFVRVNHIVHSVIPTVTEPNVFSFTLVSSFLTLKSLPKEQIFHITTNISLLTFFCSKLDFAVRQLPEIRPS